MKFLTIPNILTLGRLFFMPVVLISLLSEQFLFGAILYTIILITDLLDGWIARTYQQSSKFGAFLDPVADKLMVITCLFYLIYTHDDLYLFILGYVSLVREILIMALRQWLGNSSNDRQVLSSSWLGKFKTVFQGFAFVFFFYSLTDFFSNRWYDLGLVLLTFSIVLSLLSMLEYVKIYLKR